MSQNVIWHLDILLPDGNLNIRENYRSAYEQLTNPTETSLSIYSEMIELLGNQLVADQFNSQHGLNVGTIRIMPDCSLYVIHPPHDSKKVSTDPEIEQTVISLLRKVQAVYQSILEQQKNGPHPLTETTAWQDTAYTQHTTSCQVEQLQLQVEALRAELKQAQAEQSQQKEALTKTKRKHAKLARHLQKGNSEPTQSQSQLAQKKKKLTLRQLHTQVAPNHTALNQKDRGTGVKRKWVEKQTAVRAYEIAKLRKTRFDSAQRDRPVWEKCCENTAILQDKANMDMHHRFVEGNHPWAKNSELSSPATEMRTLLAQKSERVKELEATYLESEKENAQLQQEVTKSKEAYVSLSKHYEEHQENIKALLLEVATLKGAHQQQKSQLSEQREQICLLNEAKEDTAQQQAKETKTQQKKIETLEKTLEKTSAELINTNGVVTTLNEEIEKLNGTIGDLRQRENALQKSLEKREEEVSCLKDETAAQGEINKSKKTRIVSLTGGYNSLNEQCEEMRLELEKIQEELAQTHTENEQFGRDLLNWTNAWNNFKQPLEELICSTVGYNMHDLQKEFDEGTTTMKMSPSGWAWMVYFTKMIELHKQGILKSAAPRSVDTDCQHT